jgi:hypothetical protein
MICHSYFMARSGKPKAELVIHQKLTSPKGIVREVTIWRVPKSIRYPEGLKYRLVLVERVSGKLLLLYDNHWPKGHHLHRRGKEEPYRFTSLETLMREFKDESDRAEGAYDED